MPERRVGSRGVSSSSSQAADDQRVLEHVRTVLARLKSHIQERRRGDQSGPSPIVPTVLA